MITATVTDDSWLAFVPVNCLPKPQLDIPDFLRRRDGEPDVRDEGFVSRVPTSPSAPAVTETDALTNWVRKQGYKGEIAPSDRPGYQQLWDEQRTAANRRVKAMLDKKAKKAQVTDTTGMRWDQRKGKWVPINPLPPAWKAFVQE